MTTTLQKINKVNDQKLDQDDIAKIDDNSTKIETIINGLSSVASTGSYSDLSNKPILSTVATSGSYNDLSNKPTITGGSVVTTSSTNGNIKIDGVEKTVYTAPTYTKSDVGLGSVDNTSDLNKPISNATQSALNNKANTSVVPTIIALTSEEYSAIGSPNTNTLYLIKV